MRFLFVIILLYFLIGCGFAVYYKSPKLIATWLLRLIALLLTKM